MKTRNSIILIFAIAVPAALSSCKPQCKEFGGDRYYYVPEEEKIQLNEGDTLIYKTENDEFDTLVVNQSLSYPNTDFYECDNGVLYWRIIEEYSILIKNADQTSIINDIRLVQRGSDQVNASVNYYMAIYIKQDLFASYFYGCYQYKDSIYQDVQASEKDSLKMYFNRNYGLIAFQYNDMNIYNLYKYIKKTDK